MNFRQAKALPDLFGTFCGVYAIVCQPVGMLYIGQTSTTFLNRWEQHIALLKVKAHHNDKLQAAYDAYGEKELHFTIIEAMPKGTDKRHLKDWLDQREQFHIARIGAANERR